MARLLATGLLLAAALAVPAAGASPYCFGAAGTGCATGKDGQPVYCRPVLGTTDVECMVHAGSLEHDVCCRQHPGGRGCGAGRGNGAQCSYEWEKSAERTRHGLFWTRRLDPRQANTSGTVDFPKYCAPSGTVVAAGDERYCCTRAAATLAERDLQGVNKLRCR